ncbi:1567_t:CDS:2, partial [Racocetra persica]
MEHLECRRIQAYTKKRGPKVQEMPNQLHFTHSLQPLNEINPSLNSQDNLVDEILSNRCASCYEHKKACKHNGTLGKFRCERCRNRKIECLIQCTECYKKNKDKKDSFPQCSNCKVTRE